MRKVGVKYTPIVFEDVTTFAAYQGGRCEGITADRSALVSQRSVFPDQDNHVLLDVVMPLAPAVNNGDPRWSDTVKWVLYGLIEAEDLGINSRTLTLLRRAKTRSSSVCWGRRKPWSRSRVCPTTL